MSSSPTPLPPDVRALHWCWRELARYERALTASGRMARDRDAHALPSLLERPRAVVTSHLWPLAQEPFSDWAALLRELVEAEPVVARRMEEVQAALELAIDAVEKLAAAAPCRNYRSG